MKRLSEPPLAVLDLAPVRHGGTPAEAVGNSLVLARHADRSWENYAGVTLAIALRIASANSASPKGFTSTACAPSNCVM